MFHRRPFNLPLRNASHFTILATLEDTLTELSKKGVKVLEKIERTSYDKFGWILDPEGNRIELWEPPRNYRTIERQFPSEQVPLHAMAAALQGRIDFLAVYLSLVPQESQNLDPGRPAWPHFWQVTPTPIGDPGAVPKGAFTAGPVENGV